MSLKRIFLKNKEISYKIYFFFPSTTIGLLMLTETLFAPIWVWLFLNEIPPLSVLIGGCVIITAIILKSLDKNKVTSQ